MTDITVNITLQPPSLDIVDGAVTFEIGSGPESGEAKCGSQWIVVPNGQSVILEAVQPPIGAEGTRETNGIMKNPGVIQEKANSSPGATGHAFDGLMGSYKVGFGLNLPASLTSPSQVVKVVSKPGMVVANSRNGSINQWSVLNITPTTPGANQIAPTPAGWPGRTTYTWRDFDEDLVLDAFAAEGADNLSLSGITPPNNIISQYLPNMDRLNIGVIMSRALVESGYETASLPSYFQTGKGFYGRDSSSAIGTLCCLLMTNFFTLDQKRFVIRRLGVLGSWLWDTTEGLIAASGAGGLLSGDGGHNSWQQMVAMLGLVATNRTAEIQNSRTKLGANMMRQYFRIDSTKFAQLVPHSGGAGMPHYLFLRPVTAVTANSVTVGTRSGAPGAGDSYHVRFTGLTMKKADGTTIGVAGASPTATGGTFQDIPIATGVSGLVPGDTVYFEAPWLTLDQADWYNSPQWGAFNASVAMPYRGLNYPGPTVMLARALGVYSDPVFGIIEDYTIMSEPMNFPNATYKYPDPFGVAGGSTPNHRTFMGAFYDAHKTTLGIGT